MYLQTHICYRLLILSMRSIEDIKQDYRINMTFFKYYYVKNQR